MKCFRILIISWFSFFSTLIAQVSEVERQALIDLYNATNGDSWTNTIQGNAPWLVNDNTSDVSKWFGVTVIDNKVARLYILGNNLNGSLPESIGNLTNLTDLRIFRCGDQLTGPIPDSIGNLINLTYLALSSNGLDGIIPGSIGNLTNLTHLTLYRNKLEGKIPDLIGSLVNLTNLSLGENRLTGSIPPTLGQLTYLTNLNLFLNRLSGSIPEEIGDLTNLATLDLGRNLFSGALPVSIANLTKLTDLDLSSNVLDEPIIPELGMLTNLTNLNLYRNSIPGPIPSELGNLTNLKSLSLGENQLTGSIPPTLGQLTNLTNLNLFQNKLSEPIPIEIGNLTNLSTLALARNRLSGALPVSITNLTKLTILDLSLNALDEPIIPELGTMTNLVSLSLYRNNVPGPIPLELGNLINLTSLSLGENQLTGPIPPTLGQLINLTNLNLFQNELVGFISAEIENLVNLTSLNIGRNNLKGRIPNLPGLTTLNTTLNEFVFSDLEPFVASIPANGFSYIPQANKVDQEEVLNVTEGGAITLSSQDLTSQNNLYQWYKNGVAIDGATSKDYIIANVSNTDAGDYYFTATNSIVNGLTLTRNTVTLEVSPAIDTCGVSEAEKQALLDLYNSTNGVNWKNTLANNQPWRADIPVCDWFGVTVVDGKVIRLKMVDNGLEGSIPNSIGNLIYLKELHLRKSSLRGDIPVEIGELVNLEILYLNQALLTGELPSSISELIKLKVFQLGSNKLTGIIPASLKDLTELVSIDLGDNNFNGVIPLELGELNKLKSLRLSNNNLTGSIPITLCNLSSLKALMIENNLLSGYIPESLGNLSDLNTLFINGNEISGIIPSSFRSLTSLKNLLVNNNNLSGNIPQQLSQFANLRTFNFQGNQFVFSNFEVEHSIYESSLNNYNYSPQAKVDQEETLNVTEGGTITLSSQDLTSENNRYQWYKNGEAIDGATNKEYIISNALNTDIGDYYFTATNNIVDGLTLIRNTITLDVTDAVTIVPNVIINDAAAVQEGENAIFQVSLSEASNEIITITFAAITDTAGLNDFVSDPVQIVFFAGQTTKIVVIPTIVDNLIEEIENFILKVETVNIGTVGDTSDTGSASIVADPLGANNEDSGDGGSGNGDSGDGDPDNGDSGDGGSGNEDSGDGTQIVEDNSRCVSFPYVSLADVPYPETAQFVRWFEFDYNDPEANIKFPEDMDQQQLTQFVRNPELIDFTNQEIVALFELPTDVAVYPGEVLWAEVDGDIDNLVRVELPEIEGLPELPSDGDINEPNYDQVFTPSSNAKVKDLRTISEGVLWFDSYNSDIVLDPETVLQDDTNYYAALTKEGCRRRIYVEIVTPNVVANGYRIFCENDQATIKDLGITPNCENCTIKWYTSPRAFTTYNTDTLLENETIYYVAQVDAGGIESRDRKPILVNLTKAPPVTILSDTQTVYFKEGEEATVSQIRVKGNNVKWYLELDATEALQPDDFLIDGHTYYATQRILASDCESSERGAVTITLAPELPPKFILCEKFRPNPGDTYVFSGWVRQQEMEETSSITRDLTTDPVVKPLFLEILNFLLEEYVFDETINNEQRALGRFIPEILIPAPDNDSRRYDPLRSFIINSGSDNLTLYNFKYIQEDRVPDSGNIRGKVTTGFQFSFTPYLNKNQYDFRFQMPLYNGVDRYPILNQNDEIIKLKFENLLVDSSGLKAEASFTFNTNYRGRIAVNNTQGRFLSETINNVLISRDFKQYKPNFDYQVKDYEKALVNIIFEDRQERVLPNIGQVSFKAKGAIIEGWQRISGTFKVPNDAFLITIELKNTENNGAVNAYFDDIRVHPVDSNLKSFVYDPITQRLTAEMDENNYATFYEYDKEGGLIRVKKETERGVFTIQETRSGNSKLNLNNE